MESNEIPDNYFSKANAAFVAEEYTEAVELYTKAVLLDAGNPDYYINRSHAYQKLERHEEARRDAEKAAQLNPKEPKAYLRKGVACFHLGLYEEARAAFKCGVDVSGSDAGMQQWLTWTEEKISKSNVKKAESQVEPRPESPSIANCPPVVKYDWYQTESHICVTVLAKNLDPKQVQVNFSVQEVTMKATLPDGRDYDLTLQLSYPIVPSQSSFSVLKTKVEIRLKKCDGIRWTKLEGPVPSDVKQIPAASTHDKAIPSYPSSAPKKKDWDKIEVEIKKEEAEEKTEGEAALNQLFQKIYAEGSDEVRRAMNKSFQESGGTVLSTNWKEVAKEKLTVKPPDGMEFKRWDQ